MRNDAHATPDKNCLNDSCIGHAEKLASWLESSLQLLVY